MKDNNKSWSKLIDESYLYPEKLTSMENRLEKRILQEKRKRKVFLSTLSTIAASFLFIFLINTNTTFARAISDIPLIGQLVEYVKFDKGLSSAIKNDYVQEVNLVAWDNDNQLLLPYVVADEKNLVLFYQLPHDFILEEDDWINIELLKMTNHNTGEEIKEFSYTINNITVEDMDEDYGYIMQSFHLSGGNLPQSLNIEVELFMKNMNDSIPHSIGKYQFQFELDKLKEPIIHEINHDLTIMNQQLIVRDIKVYPTGTEVRFEFPDENTAWIKGIELVIEQDGGPVLAGKHGLASTRDMEDRWMNVFIESNYFEHPNDQTLVIKGIRLLDKNTEHITVDLVNQTLIPTVDGLELKEVRKGEEDVDLVFLVNSDDTFTMFSFQYKDTDGNSYELDIQGVSRIGSTMELSMTVKYPRDGFVILQRVLTPKTMLQSPIRIKLPSQR